MMIVGSMESENVRQHKLANELNGYDVRVCETVKEAVDLGHGSLVLVYDPQSELFSCSTYNVLASQFEEKKHDKPLIIPPGGRAERRKDPKRVGIKERLNGKK